ncbi:PCDGF protein, partial [Lanius ludovicianus]|nr:PCDGF protein [Lanius ludovicianus]
IGEWTLPGARFPLETAQDSDVGTNSLLTYQLTSNPSFSLDLNENPGGKRQPELVLEKALDREKQSSFELVLTALDGGDPVRSGTVQIRVNVTDANDNPPVFSKSVYEARVAENLPAGSLVVRVWAVDADAGTNGRVSYSFGNVPDGVLALFAVDSESGEVRTVGPLDFEEKSKYIFGLEARDGGGLNTHCKVQIDITDENDNAPEITILLRGQISSPLSHGQGRAVSLGSARCLQCRQEAAGAAVDREEREEARSAAAPPAADPLDRLFPVRLGGGRSAIVLSLRNRAARGGGDGGTSSVQELGSLVGANDNAPVFSQAEYTVRVPEDVPVGSVLVTVTATDADEGLNGQVKYS